MTPRINLISKSSFEERLEETEFQIKIIREDYPIMNPEKLLMLIQDLEELAENLRDRLFSLLPDADVIELKEFMRKKGLLTEPSSARKKPDEKEARQPEPFLRIVKG